MADFKRDLLVYAGMNSATGNMLTKGNIRMLGNGSFMSSLGIATLNVPGNAVMSGNVSMSGNVVISGNTVISGVSVVGNITMAPGMRIFAKQTPFMWNSYYHGSPVISGNNIVTAVAGGSGGGTYTGAQFGYRLSQAGDIGQLNSLNWNLENVFDFSKDFELIADIYTSGGGGGGQVGDGFVFAVGGSSSSGGDLPAGINNGSLVVWYNSFAGQLEMYRNGTVITPGIPFTSGTYYNEFMGERLTVQTIGSRRFLNFIHNNGHILNSTDVTGWIPAGNWLGITGKTGSSTATSYVTSMTLSYL